MFSFLAAFCHLSFFGWPKRGEVFFGEHVCLFECDYFCRSNYCVFP